MKLMRDLVGATLSGRYRLVSRIAGGGMGEVYRAHDLLLDRSVAVKVLQPTLARDASLVERFRSEARAAARLSHPNIVAVHDWGAEDEHTYYMVMEYVAGSDLRDLLVGRGQLTPAQACEVMRSVCEALAVAHSAGLVHRDVKPENILLARDGTVKVADFGIAAVADAERTHPGGAITGTLRYISPEQARGDDATYASDVWAAGAVLYELLTGLPPNQGSGTELLHRRSSEPLPLPSAWDPTIHEVLDAIVAKACALDPSERYATAADMAGDLRRAAVVALPESDPVQTLLDNVTGEIRLPDMDLTVHAPVQDRKARWRRRVRRSFVAAALLAVLGGGAALASYLMPDMVAVPELEGLTLEQASALAQRSDLDVEVVDERRTRAVDEGEVLAQEPADGELEEGSTIDVVLSAGLPLVRLPELEGAEAQEVERQLERLDLVVGPTRERYSMEPEGTILSMSPDATKVEVDTVVSLVVSRGPRPVEVPGLAGVSEKEAVALLKDAGLVPLVEQSYSDDVPAGRVIVTRPATGLVVPRDSEVTVYVSLGPEFETYRMPDVRNMTVDAARARLERMGLNVTVERTGACADGTTVVETDPVPGRKILEGSSVALFAC